MIQMVRNGKRKASEAKRKVLILNNITIFNIIGPRHAYAPGNFDSRETPTRPSEHRIVAHLFIRRMLKLSS